MSPPSLLAAPRTRGGMPCLSAALLEVALCAPRARPWIRPVPLAGSSVPRRCDGPPRAAGHMQLPRQVIEARLCPRNVAACRRQAPRLVVEGVCVVRVRALRYRPDRPVRDQLLRERRRWFGPLLARRTRPIMVYLAVGAAAKGRLRSARFGATNVTPCVLIHRVPRSTQRAIIQPFCSQPRPLVAAARCRERRRLAQQQAQQQHRRNTAAAAAAAAAAVSVQLYELYSCTEGSSSSCVHSEFESKELGKQST